MDLDAAICDSHATRAHLAVNLSEKNPTHPHLHAPPVTKRLKQDPPPVPNMFDSKQWDEQGYIVLPELF
jgi:hypothetical protein